MKRVHLPMCMYSCTPDVAVIFSPITSCSHYSPLNITEFSNAFSIKTGRYENVQQLAL